MPFRKTAQARMICSLLLILVSIIGSTPMTAAAPAAQSQTGSIKVITVDAEGRRVEGACFSFLWPYADSVKSLPRCDASDAGGPDGVTSVGASALVQGCWRIQASRVPPGYRNPAEKGVCWTPGDIKTVTIVLQRGGSVLIAKATNRFGDPVPGACFTVQPASGPEFTQCEDFADGVADGELRFGGLAATTYTVRLWVQVPYYYWDWSVKSVTYNSRASTATRTWVLAKVVARSTISIKVRTPRGAAVTGACFELKDSTGAWSWERWCDGGYNDALDGTYIIRDIKPGTYVLRISNIAEIGNWKPASVTITKIRGEVLSVTLQLQCCRDPV